jgi:hypothetical protein
MNFEVTSITDNEDGSANLEIDMDIETLRELAKIGLLKVLTDAVEKSVLENSVKKEES